MIWRSWRDYLVPTMLQTTPSEAVASRSVWRTPGPSSPSACCTGWGRTRSSDRDWGWLTRPQSGTPGRRRWRESSWASTACGRRGRGTSCSGPGRCAGSGGRRYTVSTSSQHWWARPPTSDLSGKYQVKPGQPICCETLSEKERQVFNDNSASFIHQQHFYGFT